MIDPRPSTRPAAPAAATVERPTSSRARPARPGSTSSPRPSPPPAKRTATLAAHRRHRARARRPPASSSSKALDLGHAVLLQRRRGGGEEAASSAPRRSASRARSRTTCKRTGDGADFTITYNGVEVPVDHVGDPPELFKPGEPVVLEGHWDADDQRLFDSDLMLVKHDAHLRGQEQHRLKQAVDGGKVPPKSSTTSTTTASGSRQRVVGDAVNLALGTAGDVLGLVASICAVVTIAVGLLRRRPDLRAARPHLHVAGARRPPSWRCSPWSTRCSPTTSPCASWPTTAAPTRRCSSPSPACGRRSRARSCCGCCSSPATRSRSARSSASRLDDPLVGWALLTMFVVCVFFFGLLIGPANPFRTFSPGARLQRSRPEPAAAEQHADGHPPADALPRLRRVHRAVRLRHRRARHRPGGRGLAGRDPALDALRLGLPLGRHRARRLVELPGARLGRLLGLGPGGERLVPALADRHRLPALGHGAGAARHVAGLEPVPAVRHLRAHHPGHLPDPVRA